MDLDSDGSDIDEPIVEETTNGIVDILDGSYQTIKFKLRTALKKSWYKECENVENDVNTISAALIKFNLIDYHTRRFLHLYIVENNKREFFLDPVCVRLIMHLVRMNGAEYKKIYKPYVMKKKNNRELTQRQKEEEKLINIVNKEFIAFYNDFYRTKFTWKIPKSPNITGSLEYYITTLITNYKVNMQEHFIKHINKLIKLKLTESWNEYNPDVAIPKEYTDMCKIIRDEIIHNDKFFKKTDFIDFDDGRTYEHYVDIIVDILNIVNFDFVNSVYYHSKYDQLSLVQVSYRINKEIERMGCTPYVFAPQKKGFTPGYMRLDHRSLCEIYGNKLYDRIKNECDNEKLENDTIFGGAKLYNPILQKILFSNKVFNATKNKLDVTFLTDGVGVSMIYKTKKPPKPKTKRKNDKGDSIKKKVDFKENEGLIYVDDMKPEDQQRIARDYNLVGLDPGKNDLIHIAGNPTKKTSLDDDWFETFRFTAKNWRHKSGETNNRKWLNAQKKNYGMNIIENALSKQKRRTTDIELLVKYYKKVEKFEPFLTEFYYKRFHRNDRFSAYCGRRRTECELVNNIKEKFTTDKPVAIGFGDYSRKSAMKGCASTPNARLRRHLSKHFPVILIDEFRTSKLHYKYHTTMEKAELPFTKKGETTNKKCHKVLEYILPDSSTKDSNVRTVKVDRDINAAKNMYKIFMECINGRERPDAFVRPKKKAA